MEKLSLPVFFILFFLNLTLAQSKIYLAYSSPPTNKIQRCNLDGSQLETLDINVDLGHRIRDLAIDTLQQKIYWTDWHPGPTNMGIGFVGKANLDGTNQKVISFPEGTPRRLWLDMKNQMVYWTDYEYNEIRRASMDLENVETLPLDLGTVGGPLALEIDMEAEMIYWSHSSTTKQEVWKAKLDGSNQSVLIDAKVGVLKLSQDKSHLYCTEVDERAIFKLAIDGGSRLDLFTDLLGSLALDIDYKNNFIYWKENYVGSGGDIDKYGLRRASLDDLMVEDITPSSPLDNFQGIELIIENDLITSVNTDLENQSLIVSPNPFDQEIYVEGSFEQSEYSLCAIDGTVVASGRIESGQNFSTKNVASGLYLLVLKAKEGWVCKKLLKP